MAQLQIVTNAVAFLGWGSVLVLLVRDWSTSLQPQTLSVALACEVLCITEVIQIALGYIKGRLALGIVLHYERLVILLAVIMPFPAVAASLPAKLVLAAWAVTELCRYPMLLVKSGPAKVIEAVRALRFWCPVVTFPLGAGAEVWAAWLALGHIQSGAWWMLVALVLPINGIGAPVAYPGMITKALQSLKPQRPRVSGVEQGVLFPANAEGKRSTIVGGTAVWAAAASAIDPGLASAIIKEKNWRQNYGKHVVALAEACCRSSDSALLAAQAGLDALYDTFDFVRDGVGHKLKTAMKNPDPNRKLHSAIVQGTGKTSPLSVPYKGVHLFGDSLQTQLKKWTEYGCAEPAAMEAIASVANHPDWTDLNGRVFVCLGATSAMGPLHQLLKWGAVVIAIARPNRRTWEGLIKTARESPGTLIFPLCKNLGNSPEDEEMASSGGADLLVDTPEIGAWLKIAIADAETRIKAVAPTTIGVYTYLDGDSHVRVSLACDAIIQEVTSGGKPISLAYLQTPSLTYLLSKNAHIASMRAYSRSWLRLIGMTANARRAIAASTGITSPLLTTPLTEEDRFIHDGLIGLQGPNYALAKTMQLWRAILGRCRANQIVSMNVGPAARTDSMVAGNNKNAKLVATSLDGMEHFPPLVVFDADTVAVCLAAMLVHDLRNPSSLSNPSNAIAHPWDLASCQAFHGGTFRLGIKPSALGPLYVVYGRLFGKAKQPVC